jgi:hypothetical protein
MPVAAAPVPSPIGVGPRFRPGPTSPQVARARPVGRFRCGASSAAIERMHVELFAHRQVVVVPAGIGVAPPLLRREAGVRGGRCSYAIRTVEPTGVVEFDSSRRPTLGELFEIWGQPLSRTRLAGFSGRIRVYVRGRLWRGPPDGVPLRRHGQVVLEVGGYVPPHRFFLFGPGR